MIYAHNLIRVENPILEDIRNEIFTQLSDGKVSLNISAISMFIDQRIKWNVYRPIKTGTKEI